MFHTRDKRVHQSEIPLRFHSPLSSVRFTFLFFDEKQTLRESIQGVKGFDDIYIFVFHIRNEIESN